MLRPADTGAARGTVYLWRYRTGTGSFPGWHLTADGAACDSIGALLQQLRRSPQGQPVMIPAAKPTPAILAIPSNGTNIGSATKLILDFDPARPPNHWQLTNADSALMLVLGLGGLDDVAKGIGDIKSGRGDYSIGLRGQQLWFWWHPRAA